MGGKGQTANKGTDGLDIRFIPFRLINLKYSLSIYSSIDGVPVQTHRIPLLSCKAQVQRWVYLRAEIEAKCLDSQIRHLVGPSSWRLDANESHLRSVKTAHNQDIEWVLA